MGVRKEVWVSCDHCGQEWGAPFETMLEAKQLISQHGWTWTPRRRSPIVCHDCHRSEGGTS